jgi:hypothetical protein
MLKYKGGHCVFSELQSKFKSGIFCGPEIAGIYLTYGLISEMNLMCPEIR